MAGSSEKENRNKKINTMNKEKQKKKNILKPRMQNASIRPQATHFYNRRL
jgi:hypothetical protein